MVTRTVGAYTAAAPCQLEGLAALREQVIELAGAAKREVFIISTDLQPQLYDHEPFLLELRRLALDSRRSRILVLVRDTDRIIKRGHRLLELASRLPSFFEIRRLADSDAQSEQCLLLVDQAAYLWLPSNSSRSGETSTYEPLKGRKLAAEFLELWERAAPDPNLRRLAL